MIRIQSLSLQLGTKELLSDVELTVYPGQKWGVIGANGSGKSTLFKLLLGEYAGDSGACDIPKNWRIGHMAQEIGTSDRSALDYVLDGDEEMRNIERQIESGEYEGEALANLYSQLEIVDGYTASVRAQQMLHGLGFKLGDDLRNVKEFSGGWRIRLNLARALMCRSDLLLLDEPTNHLDLDATFWLEQYLKAYQGTLLIISHDRDFLDNVVTGIISFENAKLFQYSGNYSSYERQKSERLAQQSAAYEKQQARIAEVENFVRRFRAKATKAKQAQSRLKELERMEKIAPAHVDSPFSFRFPMADKTSEQLLNFSEAEFGYADKAVIKQGSLAILSTSRIGLLGHNGAGKSTVIKTFAKQIELVSGERIDGTHLKIGYFAQHQLEALDLQASCALHIQRMAPKATEQEVRNFLGSFGFHGDRAFEVIEHFSGGEKARLALALLAWKKPNLLLLDEPTNHLDLEMRHALSLALQTFEGAIVLISHDRYLLRNAVDEFWLVDSGAITPFDGDLEDYQKWLLNSDSETESASAEKPVLSKTDKKKDRQAKAALREKLKPYAQAIKKLESSMEKIQTRLAELEVLLADPGLYESQNEALTDYLKEQGQLKTELEELELDWLSKTEELEALQADLQ